LDGAVEDHRPLRGRFERVVAREQRHD
jgi:hypothetical protein